MDQTVLEQVVAALVPLLMALGSWASVELAKFIRAKVRNEYVQGALLRLNDAVATVVRKTHVTIVEEVKAAAEDGRIDAEEAKRIRDKAVKEIQDYLGANGVSELERIFDKQKIVEIIESKIEAEVLRVKKEME